MHAISSYCGKRPTNTATNPHTQTGPITIHCAAASAQCKDDHAPSMNYYWDKWIIMIRFANVPDIALYANYFLTL